ncbi:Protein of unknown function DUF2581 [Actinobacteria bacterium OK074]|nr:Protein of unknown function DUF2581 [Actinobacteria bacterium OK074]
MPVTRDRIYRTPAGMAGGVLLLVIAGWLGIDALIHGEGRTPWLALATLILVVPLVSAFTLRPAVFVNDERLRVRNPFRVVVLPWGEVAGLRSGYSNEVVAKSGAKFQLWSIPVSLRARKKAVRREARQASGVPDNRTRGLGLLGGGLMGGGLSGGSEAASSGPARATTDQIMDDLKALAEKEGTAERAQGEVTVRWAYEVIGPAVAGAVVLVILLVVG